MISLRDFRRFSLFIVLTVWFCAAWAADKAPGREPNCLGIIDVPIEYTNPVKKTDPSVHVRVNGIDGKYIIDTGTSHHLIFDELLVAAGITASPGFNTKSITIQFGVAMVDFDNFFSVSPIIPLREEGFAGILSASKFADKGNVLIDFKGNHMAFDAEGLGVERFLQCQGLSRMDSISITWVGRGFGVVYIPIDLLGRKSVIMNLDTGSGLTTISSDLAPTGAVRRAGPAVMNVDGVIKRSAVLEQVSLTMGGRKVELSELAVLDDTSQLPDGTRWQGKLGMSVLRDFRILLPQQESGSLELLQ